MSYRSSLVTIPLPSSVRNLGRSVSARARLTLLSALLALPATKTLAEIQTAAATRALSDEIVVLEKLEVLENQDGGAPLNAAASLRELKNTAGSVSVIDSASVERGRVGTAADVLAFQPGVFAQSTGGQDALRVSIRGSGINRGQGSFREGITFLFDGLPLTGPGGSPYELFEPLGLDHTDILRGPNGFKYGGLALGGVINYATKTGYDASVFETRGEFGSFGYRKGQIASGQVVGNADYYATVIGSEREGFQDLTEGHSARVIANLGYKFNDVVQNRVYLRYGATSFENPGNLTVAQIEDDPTQANAAAVANSANPLYRSKRIQQGSTWIADKLSIEIGADSLLELGAVFHDYPIDIQGTTASLGNVTATQAGLYPDLVAGTPRVLNTVPGRSLGGSRSIWWHDDLTLSGRYETKGTLFERESISNIGVTSTVELIGKVKTYTDNSVTRLAQNRDYSGSSNSVLFATNELELVPKLWSTTGAQLIHINRQAEYIQLAASTNPRDTPLSYSRDAVYFAPRFGLRYDATPDLQFFGNASRTVEPADSWKYNAITASSAIPQVVGKWNDLKEQHADTLELGTRARHGIFEGGLTIYRAWIENELLSVETTPGNSATRVNSNASPTVHQGVEVSLNIVLWQDGGADFSAANPHRLVYRQAFTLNDFFYRNDSVFGSNDLPGLPRQFYQGELAYDHPGGFYAGFGTQVSSSYFVDYDNSFSAPSYVIFNARIGYAPPKANWEVFLDFRNLTDENYVSAVSPTYTSRATVGTGPGRDQASYQPGDGRSVFGGFAFKF